MAIDYPDRARAAQVRHLDVEHPFEEYDDWITTKARRKEQSMATAATEPAEVLEEHAADGTTEETITDDLAAELVETPGPGQLALPGIDGLANDWIELAVAGVIPLDRGNPDDCALIRRLVAGKSIDLDVSGYVVGRFQKLKRDEETGDEVTFSTKVKVTGLRREAPFS